MAYTSAGVVVLAAGARSVDGASAIVLGLGRLTFPDDGSAPNRFTAFRDVPVTESLSADFENELSSFRLLYASVNLVVYHPQCLRCYIRMFPFLMSRTE
jgi:hypothetical protein